MSNREPIPKHIEAEVLIKCCRRCCICYGLEGDLSEKQGQIAHLHKNSANNAPDNLAYLCLPHHDRYDGRTSQSKGLTMEEVKNYRMLLWNAIERNLHLQSIRTKPSNPKQKEILNWKDKLVSVYRYRAVEGSMQPSWVPPNQRDYRIVDCNENCFRYQDVQTGINHAVPLEDVKVSFDTAKQRLLLILSETHHV